MPIESKAIQHFATINNNETLPIQLKAIGVKMKFKGYSYERFTGMFVSIEFVHQLQNLIYILTNEELTLNN